jgi:hypothetical protein
MFMSNSRVLVLLAFAGSFSACGSGSGSGSTVPTVITPPAGPVTFHCTKDATCPEVMIAGDPFSELNMAPDPFRGYGDPSLEYDSTTGTLWLAYSWLNIEISDPGPPLIFDLGVRTHLARSDDNGASFTFQRSVNDMAMEAHPDTGVMGWSVHEVPTLLKEPSGDWQLLWYKYFNPFGTVTGVDERQEYLYWRTIASAPDQLGDVSEVWARALATSPSWGAPIDFNLIPELANCVTLTEPGLFAFNDEIYLASSCLVADATGRRADLERLVLLKQTANGYSFVGDIMDAQDATDLGVDVIQQADISIARDGSIIMIVTPIILDADPSHQGCVVFEFADFASGTLVRDGNGVAVPRTVITSDGNGLGPGLCTYDANSDTGVLLVITTVTNNGTDIEFSLRATGVHP